MVNIRKRFFIYVNALLFFNLNAIIYETNGYKNISKPISHLIGRYKRMTQSRNGNTDRPCTLPAVSPDKYYEVNCNGQELCSSIPDESVAQFTTLTFLCEEGYFRREESTFQTFCLNGAWAVPVHKCNRMCSQLSGENANLECTRENKLVDCSSNLLPGTTVNAKCKRYFYHEGRSTYDAVMCQDDGKWSNTLPKCVPECGQTSMHASGSVFEPLIYKGVNSTYGDSPWHVAIYDIRKNGDQSNELICGGTIVTTQLVVSASHCFYNIAESVIEDEKYFEVFVSKITRDYNRIDNAHQKAYEIREIRTLEGFDTEYYENDVAILILAKKISLNENVLPACVHWFDFESISQYQDGTMGKVSGWGRIDNFTYSDRLLEAKLPFVSRKTCIKRMNKDLSRYLTVDKFCVGSVEGPGVSKGDSGGGLLVPDVHPPHLYYLSGVASIKLTGDPRALFTDLNKHMKFIKDIREELEREIQPTISTDGPRTTTGRPRTTSQFKPAISWTPVHCDDCDPDELHVNKPAIPSTPVSCDECEPECGKLDPNSNSNPNPRVNTPWFVIIYDKLKNDISGGTIVTSRLIVTAARVFYNEVKSRKADYAFYSIYTGQKVYKIKEIKFVEKGFHGSSSYFDNDIAIAILSEKIVFGIYVRPACVHWNYIENTNLQDDEIGKVTFGEIKNKGLFVYTTLELPFISQITCTKLLSRDERPFMTHDKFCARPHEEDSIILQHGFTGSGMIFRDEYSGLNFLRGIASATYSNSALGCTDLNKHMKWMKKVHREVDNT